MIIWIDISLHEPRAVVRVDSLSAPKSCLIHPLATLPFMIMMKMMIIVIVFDNNYDDGHDDNDLIHPLATLSFMIMMRMMIIVIVFDNNYDDGLSPIC